jgi:hypothetical protein
MVHADDTATPIMLSRALVLFACPAFAKPSAPATDSCDLAVDVTQAPLGNTGWAIARRLGIRSSSHV